MKNKANEALGLMKDKHIMEAANYKKAHWGWIPVAAVLALAILAGTLAHPWNTPSVSLKQSMPGESEASVVVNTGSLSPEVWASEDAEHTEEVLGPNGSYAKGSITVLPILQEYFDKSTDPTTEFSVCFYDFAGEETRKLCIEELTVLGIEYVYGQPLMMTRAEIEAVSCPEDMALAVGYRLTVDGGIGMITKRTLEWIHEDPILVEVDLDTMYYIDVYHEALRNGEYASTKEMAVAMEAESRMLLDALLPDMGLTMEDLVDVQIHDYVCTIVVELTKEEIRWLLTDALFEDRLSNMRGAGSDYVGDYVTCGEQWGFIHFDQWEEFEQWKEIHKIEH